MLASAKETLTVSPGSMAPFWLRFSELSVAPAAMTAGEIGITETTAAAELLAELVSVEEAAEAITTFVTRPDLVVVAVMVNVAPVAGRRVPRLQVIKPA